MTKDFSHLSAEPQALTGRVQQYAWGMKADDSVISELVSPEAYDCSRPLAELWVGAHPRASASIFDSGNSLELFHLLDAAPEAFLSPATLRRFGRGLPFLFKVLSIRTALSIQAHPDKQRALQLHKERPEDYPDDNHKPEIAIALTPVELLSGFRSAEEIRRQLLAVPEFRTLFSQETYAWIQQSSCEDAPSCKRAFFEALMHSSPNAVHQSCRDLYSRLEQQGRRSREEEWILRLSTQYPDGDVGLFCFFFLNLLTLQPGEALFSAPNTPHAYLHGELVECMANSDNVVRAGLTPKTKDVETLLSMLDYSERALSLVEITRGDGFIRYRAPVEEFEVQFVESVEATSLDAQDIQLLFCVQGQGRLEVGAQEFAIRQGSAYLLSRFLSSVRLTFSGGKLFRVVIP